VDNIEMDLAGIVWSGLGSVGAVRIGTSGEFLRMR
jgi:hypothetical protein